MSEHEPIDYAGRHSVRSIEQNKTKRHPVLSRTLGALALCGVVGGLGVVDSYRQNQLRVGEVSQYSEASFSAVSGGRGAHPAVRGQAYESINDGELRVVSWNMHNELSSRSDEIISMLHDDRLDAMLLQEVSENDVKNLGELIPEYDVYFIVADTFPQGSFPKIDSLEPFGNAIIANVPAESVESTAMSGTSDAQAVANFVPAFAKDTWDIVTGDPEHPWLNSKLSRMSTRAATNVELPVEIGDETVKVNLTNTHLSFVSGGEIQQKQYQQLSEFVGGISKGDINMVCGDLNTTDRSVIASALPDYVVPITEPTTRYGTEPIDHCVTDSQQYNASVEVLDNHMTDHKAIRATIRPEQTTGKHVEYMNAFTMP